MGLRKRQAEGRVKKIDQILKRIETEKQINQSNFTLGNKEKQKANTTAQNTFAALMNEDEDDHRRMRMRTLAMSMRIAISMTTRGNDGRGRNKDKAC